VSFATYFYHIIRPKEAMLRRLAERPTDGNELLIEPQLWKERGNSHDLTPIEQRLAYIKVMFMAALHDEYLAHPVAPATDPFYDHLRHFLGSEPFTPAVFDLWWSIETIDNDVRVLDEIEADIGIESLHKVAAPGLDYVRKRLHRLSELKDAQAANTDPRHTPKLRVDFDRPLSPPPLPRTTPPKTTESGLPIRKLVQFADPTLFTEENDHNPTVAAICPDCHGVGRWSEDRGAVHRDYMCPKCRGLGCVDSPAKMFDPDAPPVTVQANSKGWVTCPGCGIRFNTNYRDTWTGWRHKCGQRLHIESRIQ
jgi:hypothetical protein